MYAVAITRKPQTTPEQVELLAKHVGAEVYDMRLRLSSPLPSVLANAVDADQATQWLRTIRQLGFGAIACDLDRVPTGDAILAGRSFELGADAMTLRTDDGRSSELPYADILALVHAMLVTDTETTTLTKEKKLSATRAIVSGGLLLSKTSTSSTHNQEAEHEPVLYVVRNSGREPIALRQNQLKYDGLGSPPPPTRLACFQQLVGRLRAAAPDALYDNRLLSQKRKASNVEQARDLTTARKSSRSTSTITQTNQGATELAVYLIAVAHLRGQL